MTVSTVTLTRKTLTPEQCKAILAAIRSKSYRNWKLDGNASLDECLFISLLLVGAEARVWTWSKALDQALDLPLAVYGALRALATAKKLVLEPVKPSRFSPAHWVMGVSMESPVFTSPSSLGKPWTTEEVTRRLKRYARLAGLDARAVNLRMVANTHHWLKTCGTMDEAAEMLCLSSPPFKPTTGRAQARAGGQQDWKTHLHGIGRRSASRRLLSSSS